MFRFAVFMGMALTVGVAHAGQHAYVPFPDGYGYMQDTKALQAATDAGKRPVIRDHAWRLWAGIMQPVEGLGWPVWFTWPNTFGAFQADTAVVPATANTDVPATGASLRLRNARNRLNAPDIITQSPQYPVPAEVIKRYPGGICKDSDGQATVCDGKTFVNNGDIMIPTESLSQEAFDDIRDERLYLQATLDEKHKRHEKIALSQRAIVTKHMYWPVKKDGISPLPVWENNVAPNFSGYAGYEYWDSIVGVDPTGKAAGEKRDIEFLFGVQTHSGDAMTTRSRRVPVVSIEDFYYHQVTKDDWAQFSDADKAILNAASYWSYNSAFGPGDYLITVAMHVNTRELPSWTLQSVWWSTRPDAGPYAADRPHLAQAKGPWQHYLLTDSYAVPPNAQGELDVAVNPYIEGVIHPIGTSCRNCHVRAGWPTGSAAGQASYQNPDCPGLLTYLVPASDCLKELTLTDYLWIIPDRAIKASGN